MPAIGRWFVTPHAVARMREIEPRLAYDAALAELVRLSELAHPTRRHASGALIYRGPRQRRLRFIVTDPTEPGRLPTLITVLRDPLFRAAGRRIA